MRQIGLAVILAVGLFLAPFAAEGQLAGNVPRIGYLSWGSAPPSDPWVEPFRERLRELGYVEGQNIVIEYRWAQERSPRGRPRRRLSPT